MLRVLWFKGKGQNEKKLSSAWKGKVDEIQKRISQETAYVDSGFTEIDCQIIYK